MAFTKCSENLTSVLGLEVKVTGKGILSRYAYGIDLKLLCHLTLKLSQLQTATDDSTPIDLLRLRGKNTCPENTPFQQYEFCIVYHINWIDHYCDPLQYREMLVCLQHFLKHSNSTFQHLACALQFFFCVENPHFKTKKLNKNAHPQPI